MQSASGAHLEVQHDGGETKARAEQRLLHRVALSFMRSSRGNLRLQLVVRIRQLCANHVLQIRLMS